MLFASICVWEAWAVLLLATYVWVLTILGIYPVGLNFEVALIRPPYT